MHLLWLCSTRGIPISYFMHHCSVWIFCMSLCYREHINSIDLWHLLFFLFAWSQRSYVVYGCQNSMFNWLKCVVLLPWWAWNPAQPDRASDWLACRHWYIMQPADSPNGDRAALELLLWAVRQESVSFLMIWVVFVMHRLCMSIKFWFALTLNTVFSAYLIGWGWGRWGTWVLRTESHVGKTPSSFHPLPHCLNSSV